METKTKKNIYLIGSRACGKTTVGRLLAKRLGLDFVDTDSEFVRVNGSIARFVEDNGWDAFRDAESRVLEDIAGKTGLVVGCGGGIVLRPENRDLLVLGRVAYLKASPEVLAKRLEADPGHDQRPSLTGKSIKEEVKAVLDEREGLYASCAQGVIDAEASLELVLERLAKLLE